MRKRSKLKTVGARAAVVPAYLVACLTLGGSSQGVWSNMALQLGGLGLLGWAALGRSDEEELVPAARQALMLAICGVVLVAIQLIPLPAAIWSTLGPRRVLVQDFELLGVGVPAQPLSLTPAMTLDALLRFIPPLAVFCVMIRLKAYRPQLLAAVLVAATVVGIGLGAVQVATSNGIDLSPWYLYPVTNGGKAVGFFANANHMATLLVITIPFLAAIVASARTGSTQRFSAVLVIAAGLLLLFVVGLALNGSVAGYGLAIPVLVASSLIVLGPANRLRPLILAASAIGVLAAVVALQSTAIGATKVGAQASSSVQSRADLLATTVKATADYMPLGSGLGSFRSVYPLYENWRDVTRTYAIHAHNDYAELALELGLPGVILMLLFLAWWATAVWRTWRTTEPAYFTRAASIASAAILIHSIVDFPLRTAAIAACFAVCLALLADKRSAPRREAAELRRTRHVEFG